MPAAIDSSYKHLGTYTPSHVNKPYCVMPEHTIIRPGMNQNSVGAPRLSATRCSFTNFVVRVGLPRMQMREDDMLHPKLCGVFFQDPVRRKYADK
jgi:hypothetical protein